jgi:hypothetical protein
LARTVQTGNRCDLARQHHNAQPELAIQGLLGRRIGEKDCCLDSVSHRVDLRGEVFQPEPSANAGQLPLYLQERSQRAGPMDDAEGTVPDRAQIRAVALHVARVSNGHHVASRITHLTLLINPHTGEVGG